jgi:multiple sugar transport system substrate-binding protein
MLTYKREEVIKSVRNYTTAAARPHVSHDERTDEPMPFDHRTIASDTRSKPCGQVLGAKRRHRGIAAGALIAILALLSAGCTGTSKSSANDDASKPVTITLWHGFNLPADLAALNANLERFHKLHPNITVKATPNVTDDKILQGVRTPRGPDIVSSFSTDAVGALCGGALTDLNPFLKRDGIDKSTFVTARINYTQFKGNQCTLPFLGDAEGLYYNIDMFKAAGITAPPKTWSEFTTDAVKLTKSNGASYDQLGFMPSFHGYETTPGVWMTQWSPTWVDPDGKSNLSKDPNVSAFFNYTRELTKALGGYTKLEKYRTTFGDEWSAENAFEVGKVAMQLDGEWRNSIIRNDKSKVKFATAPAPVPDNQIDTYGKGYLTGTIIGISKASRHQNAAWELVKFLATDTDALVSFGNQVNNVPSTVASLNSPEVIDDPNFQTFIKISANKHSASTPASANGAEYLTILSRFAYKWEAGRVSDLHGGLVEVDKQIDVANARSAT